MRSMLAAHREEERNVRARVYASATILEKERWRHLNMETDVIMLFLT